VSLIAYLLAATVSRGTAGKNRFLGTIGHHLAAPQQQDTGDLRRNLVNVLRYENYRGAGAH
jgi:hypothetical protein